MAKQSKRSHVVISTVTAAAVGAGGACGGGDSGTPRSESTTTTTAEPTTTTTSGVSAETTTTAAVTAATVRTTRTTRAARQPAPTTTTSAVYYGPCGIYEASQTTSSTTPTTSASTSSTAPPTTLAPPPTPTPVCGRPYRKRRKSLILPDIAGGDPLDAASIPAAIAELRSDARAAEGARWLSDARSERASVPAFSELALHLSAVGAPVDLIRQTHEAALDEIRHAQECLRLGSLFLGQKLELGSFPTIAGRRVAGRKWWSRKRHLAYLAVQSLIDGCVSEGNSADDLWRRAEVALPDVAAIARGLAADEDRHTDLAWQIVHWCRVEGGAHVERALSRTMRQLSTADLGAAQSRLRIERGLPTLVPAAV